MTDSGASIKTRPDGDTTYVIRVSDERRWWKNWLWFPKILGHNEESCWPFKDAWSRTMFFALADLAGPEGESFKGLVMVVARPRRSWLCRSRGDGKVKPRPCACLPDSSDGETRQTLTTSFLGIIGDFLVWVLGSNATEKLFSFGSRLEYSRGNGSRRVVNL